MLGPAGPAGFRGDPGMAGEFGQEGDVGDIGPRGEDGFPVRKKIEIKLIKSNHLFFLLFILSCIVI